MNKYNARAIEKYLKDRMLEKEKTHTKAAVYRRDIMPKIRHSLDELASTVNADRAMLFELSNGSQNLIGLPFLYATATSEVISKRTFPVIQKYQKVNTSIIASFLEALEEKGYFYFNDLEDIKDEFPTMYQFMKPNNVRSGMFYTLYGVDNNIGFLCVTTTGQRKFPREGTITKIASTAQLISSLLNYNKINNGE
ncbi:MAG: hypothetical protein PF569_08730 [Candidatus Woesearchaeota archaeon]|jgi:hypothetical protein|nr:hypothetical protein [Candidatus Woesearchaeota archaeon]